MQLENAEYQSGSDNVTDTIGVQADEQRIMRKMSNVLCHLSGSFAGGRWTPRDNRAVLPRA
jgi:hypothetical protein